MDTAEPSRQTSASMASPANYIVAPTISRLARAHSSRFPAAIGRPAPPRDSCAGIDQNTGSSTAVKDLLKTMKSRKHLIDEEPLVNAYRGREEREEGGW